MDPVYNPVRRCWFGPVVRVPDSRFLVPGRRPWCAAEGPHLNPEPESRTKNEDRRTAHCYDRAVPHAAPRYLCALALLVFSCAPAPAPAQNAAYEPDWNQPAPPHKVVGNVYFVGTTELGVFLIATRDGHILIDPGFDETVPLIRDSMRMLGLEYEDIRVLLTTQAHFDHAAGLARVKRDTGARLEAMDGDAELLERGGRGDFRFGDTRMFPPVTVDRVLVDGDIVEHGGVRLVARHTPGHTKGATTFVTTLQDDGRAYQMVFATSTTINPGTSLVDNDAYPEIVADWQRTYAILDSLVGDVWVSAHTAFFDMEGKRAQIGTTNGTPYYDPVGFRRFIADGRARFAATLAEQLREQQARIGWYNLTF